MPNFVSERSYPYWDIENRGTNDKAWIIADLRSKGCQVSASATKKDLLDHYEHVDRSRECYFKYKKPELVKLAVLRGHFKSSEANKMSAADLHYFLAKADKNRKFKKFLLLPPELRLRIYDFYIDAFGRNPNRFIVPPLAHVSKKIWKEFVPVFHKRAVFELTFHKVDGCVVAPAETMRFLKYARTRKFPRNLRWVRIRVVLGFGQTSEMVADAYVEIGKHVADKVKGYSIRVDGSDKPGCVEYQRRVMFSFCSSLDELSKGKSIEKFGKEHLQALARAVPLRRLR